MIINHILNLFIFFLGKIINWLIKIPYQLSFFYLFIIIVFLKLIWICTHIITLWMSKLFTLSILSLMMLLFNLFILLLYFLTNWNTCFCSNTWITWTFKFLLLILKLLKEYKLILVFLLKSFLLILIYQLIDLA